MAPISSDELYGSGELEAAAPSTAQLATFVVPLGSPPAAPLQPPFAAESVAVDNATGRWWRIAGRWVPPWTIGGMLTVDPPTNQLEVLARTPGGQVSEQAGDELVIVAHSVRQPPSAGIYSPPSVAVDYRTASLLLNVNEAGIGSQVLIPAPAAGLSIVVVRITATAEATGIRGLVRLSLDDAIDGTRRYVTTIAPDAPTHAADVPPGAVRFSAGGAAMVTHEAQAGAGIVAATMHAVYYLEAVA